MSPSARQSAACGAAPRWEGHEFMAPGKEGIIGLTFSNAIHLSGWTNREVKIPFDTAEYEAELEKRKEEEKIKSAK